MVTEVTHKFKPYERIELDLWCISSQKRIEVTGYFIRDLPSGKVLIQVNSTFIDVDPERIRKIEIQGGR